MTRAAVIGMSTCAVLAAGLAAGASTTNQHVTFHAIAVNMSNVGRTGADPVDVTIERWSTPEELAKLRDALVEKGQDALMSELQRIKPRAGYIRRSNGGIGWDIQYARRIDLPDRGHRVIPAFYPADWSPVCGDQMVLYQDVLFVLDEAGIVRWSYVSPFAVNPGGDGILATLESLEGVHV